MIVIKGFMSLFYALTSYIQIIIHIYILDDLVIHCCCFQFWDLRSPNPMATVNLPDRVYCADVVGNLLDKAILFV